MTTFKKILNEIKLGRLKRARSPEAERKFSIRQAFRAAQKVNEPTVVPPVRGVGGRVPSHTAIKAQFQADVGIDPETLQYTSSRFTPTEDEALSGNIKRDEKMQRTFIDFYRKFRGQRS